MAGFRQKLQAARLDGWPRPANRRAMGRRRHRLHSRQRGGPGELEAGCDPGLFDPRPECDAAGNQPNSDRLHRDLRSGRTGLRRKPCAPRRQSHRLHALRGLGGRQSWWNCSRRWRRISRGWRCCSTRRTSARRVTEGRSTPLRSLLASIPVWLPVRNAADIEDAHRLARARAERRPGAPHRRDHHRAPRFDRRSGGAASAAGDLLDSAPMWRAVG